VDVFGGASIAVNYKFPTLPNTPISKWYLW